MGLQAKELNKLMAVLGNDRLIQVQVYHLYFSSIVDQVGLGQVSPKRTQGRCPKISRQAILLYRLQTLL